jgi:hypothetical protein
MHRNERNNRRSENIPPKGVNRKNIIWPDFQKKGRFLQIYNKGLEFSILSDKYEQCHPFVWCKDFLHDVVHSSINNKPFEIYRFNYNPEINPRPCLKQTRILIANSRDSKIEKKIPACLDFINQIEDKLKIPRTKVRKCINPIPEYAKNGVYIFQGHKRWLFAPPMLSLYTLLIRVGFAHFKGQEYGTTVKGLKQGLIKPYQTKDCRWILEVEPALHKIVRFGDKQIFYRDMKLNYPASMATDVMHSRMGIVGFATDMIAKNAGQSTIMPYWHIYK